MAEMHKQKVTKLGSQKKTLAQKVPKMGIQLAPEIDFIGVWVQPRPQGFSLKNGWGGPGDEVGVGCERPAAHQELSQVTPPPGNWAFR